MDGGMKENEGSLASRLAMVTSEEKALNVPLGAGRYYYNATPDINAFTTPVRCHYAAPASFAGGFNFIGTTTDTILVCTTTKNGLQYGLPTTFHPKEPESLLFRTPVRQCFTAQS